MAREKYTYLTAQRISGKNTVGLDVNSLVGHDRFLSAEALTTIESMINMLQAIDRSAAYVIVHSNSTEGFVIDIAFLPDDKRLKNGFNHHQLQGKRCFVHNVVEDFFRPEFRKVEGLRGLSCETFQSFVKWFENERSKALLYSAKVAEKDGFWVGLISLSAEISEKQLSLSKSAMESFRALIQSHLNSYNADKHIGGNKELYDKVLNNTTEGIIVIQNERIVWGNIATQKILGYPENDYSDSLYTMIVPEDVPIVKKRYKEIIHGETIESFDIRIVNQKQEQLWLLVNGTIINYYGQPAVLAFLQDITMRKKAEEALKLSESRYRMLVNKSTDIFVEIDEDGNQLFISPAAEKLTGFTLEELQRPFNEVIHPDDIDEVLKHWKIALENPDQTHRIEYRHIHKTRGYIWVEAHGQSFLHDPDIRRVFTFVRDISDRKELELEVQEQQELYEMITTSVSDVIWIYNLAQMKFTYISPSVERLRGYTVEEAMAQTLFESLTPESIDLVKERIEEGLKTLEKNPRALIESTEELQQPCKDGSLVWIEVSTSVRVNKKGEHEILGVSRNIQDRKMAAKALFESKERYRKLIQNMEEGVLLINKKGEIVSSNEAAERILNIKPLTGKDIAHFRNMVVYEDGAPYSLDKYPLKSVLETEGAGNNSILGVRLPDGVTWLKIHSDTFDLGDSNDLHVLATFTDISNLKQKNQKLKESNATKDKFISIMAHDLKSSFNVIMGYTELLKETSLEHGIASVEEMASLTHNSAIHTLGLLNNLLDWSRAQTDHIKFDPEIIDLDRLLDSVLIMQNDIAQKKSVSLLVDIKACKKAYADKNMMSTILRNIISNAIKFTNAGGTVRIVCDKIGAALQLRVEDNGVGMDKEKVQYLFSAEDVSFTPGTDGEMGTGLGLNVSKEFVGYHQGRIYADSEIGKGTTIYVEIPMPDVF
ncbi:Sensor histidine kinase YycG [Salinivirga cyanobacteriivorans]|uniref:histidine kinase n=1 Tax=Salinivirga cyanobacteriivorans TaxID=1307839 RepID=A0A0S2HYH1_9BACT|nr:PAS domain S-box protein [Salinivirga cyanobacteriivorans]ALO15030.1 Sensor histidine kinase YycG [Salinivirga cyanobacteriivorans]